MSLTDWLTVLCISVVKNQSALNGCESCIPLGLLKIMAVSVTTSAASTILEEASVRTPLKNDMQIG